jgi:hypothetical protein
VVVFLLIEMERLQRRLVMQNAEYLVARHVIMRTLHVLGGRLVVTNVFALLGKLRVSSVHASARMLEDGACLSFSTDMWVRSLLYLSW